MKSLLHALTTGALLVALPAQDAKVTVLHGVPGLSAPVQVFANGGLLFSFDYGEQRGPLTLAPGSYQLEVRLNGSPILSTNATLAANDDVAVIAHIDATGSPRLGAFANGLQALTLPSSRLYVRHTAQAPAVDVILGQGGNTVGTIPNLANGGSASADVAPGVYSVRLNVAGTSTTAFGPVDVAVENGLGYGIFAVGDVSAPNFTLLTQRVPLTARVTVLHGIPGLPSPVSVRANGNTLFQFDYRDVRGPLVVNPGSYAFDVLLGTTPVLARNDNLLRGDDVTVVAHLDGTGGNALSAFANNTSPVAPGEARVTVRHLAQAPNVDVAVDNQGTRLATLTNLANGQETTAPLPPGNLEVSLFAAGTSTRAFGPVGFRPQAGVAYQFLAIGSLSGNSFAVEVLQNDLKPAVPTAIATRVGGWGCGPTIGASPSGFDYGQPFELRVQGATSNAMAVINYGDSVTAAGPLSLPLSLQPFGAPTCFLNTNVLATIGAMTDASGNLAIGYLVPRSLAGVFQPGYFQVGVMGASNALGVVTTEYLELR